MSDFTSTRDHDFTTDPYAGQGRGPRAGGGGSTGEVRSELEQFAARLRDLGATPDEIEPVVASWDDLDPADTKATEGEAPPWTAERRTALVNAPDAELAGLLQAARDEYDLGTTTEGEAADRKRKAELTDVQAAAAEVIGKPVGDVLDWVGDDADRAAAVLNLETADGAGAGRKTLVAPLSALLADQPEPVASAPRGTITPAPVQPAGGPAGTTTPPEASAASPGPHSPSHGTPAPGAPA